MIQVSQKEFDKIHNDYKGMLDDGRQSGFNGSVRRAAGLKGWGEYQGTTLLIEGIHFEITKGEEK